LGRRWWPSAQSVLALVALAGAAIAPRALDISNGSSWVKGLSVLSLLAILGAVCLGVLALLPPRSYAPRARFRVFATAANGALAVAVLFWTVVAFPTGVLALTPVRAISASQARAELAHETEFFKTCPHQETHQVDEQVGAIACAYNSPPILERATPITARLPLLLVLGIWGSSVAFLGWALAAHRRVRATPLSPSLT